MLTNEFGTSTILVPNMATFKIEHNDDNILMLSILDNNGCHIVNHYDTSHLSFRVGLPFHFLVM